MVCAQRGKRGTNARMIGRRLLALVGNDLEPGVARIAAHHPEAGRFLEVQGSRTHSDCQPGTNSTPLWIVVLGGSPGLEQDVMQQVLGLAALADDPDGQPQKNP